MKQNFPFICILLTAVGLTLFLQACKKTVDSYEKNTFSTGLTIEEAKQHFQKTYVNSARSSATQKEKHPQWDGAQLKPLSSGRRAVIVPLYREGTYVKVTDKKMVKFGFLNYMMMYKGNDGSIITEWVVLKPSEKWLMTKKSRKYDGNILVKTWEGKRTKIYSYKDGETLKKNVRMAARTSDSEEPDDKNEDDDVPCLVTQTLTVTTTPHNCPCEGHTYEQISICKCPVRPRPGSSTTIDVTVDVECDPGSDDTPGGSGGGGNDGHDPGNDGSGGAGGTSSNDYVPASCNADPDYQVPTVPPPPGTEYMLPCSELDIPVEDLLDLALPTASDKLFAFYNDDPDPDLHLTLPEMQFLADHPAISEELLAYLMSESVDVKRFGKWAIGYLVSNPNLSFDVFRNQFLMQSEGQEEAFNEAFWDNPANSFPPQDLPSWANFEAAFPKRSDPLYNTPSKLHISIGGDVLAKVGNSDKVNTCATRVSKALNYSGVTIPYIPNQTFQGSDGKYYFIVAAHLNRWMRKAFGCANPNTAKGEYLNTNSVHYNASQVGKFGSELPSLLSGVSGIYSMVSNDERWATGHADILYPNAACDPPGGSCYFNGPIKYLDVWILN